MNHQNYKFKLVTDCVPVKGHKRSIMYDLNRKINEFIPNTLVDFIEEADGKSKEEMLAYYDLEFHPIVNEYIEFLNIHDFSLWMPEKVLSNFIPLNSTWDYPAQISNAIIDIDLNSDYNIHDALTQLGELGCMHIQIRAYCAKSISFYQELLEKVRYSSYLSIEIITGYENEQDIQEIREFVKNNNRVKAIILHSAPFNAVENHLEIPSKGNIAYTLQKITSPSDCHNNSQHYFNTSIQIFSEAQQHHIYYNRKVSIAVDGNIKNCASHAEFFGNVKIDNISNIISLVEFQKLWYVKKNETEVCKDCEFRYMCMDSRLPIQREDGSWYHKTSCNYNPYIAKWKGEEGYLTIEDTKFLN